MGEVDFYTLAMTAEGAVLEALGALYNVPRYLGMTSREHDVEYRTRVMDAIVQARMADARGANADNG